MFGGNGVHGLNLDFSTFLLRFCVFFLFALMGSLRAYDLLRSFFLVFCFVSFLFDLFFFLKDARGRPAATDR